MTTVETAESYGFSMNNLMLLFMGSKLLHTAIGHVKKLNDCEESPWQANGLQWECKEALRVELQGCVQCLRGDICNIIWAYYCLVCLFCEPARLTEDLQKRGALLFCHALSDWLFPAFNEAVLTSQKKQKQTIISLELFLFPCIYFKKNNNSLLRGHSTPWDVHRYMYTHTSLPKHVKAPTECSTEDHCDIYNRIM